MLSETQYYTLLNLVKVAATTTTTSAVSWYTANKFCKLINNIYIANTTPIRYLFHKPCHTCFLSIIEKSVKPFASKRSDISYCASTNNSHPTMLQFDGRGNWLSPNLNVPFLICRTPPPQSNDSRRAACRPMPLRPSFLHNEQDGFHRL